MSKLLTVVAHFQAQPGKEDALRQALLALVQPTRAEEGCVQYDLHEENAKPGNFVFYENWKSKEALDLHMASPHFSAFLPRVPELCGEPPKIAMCTRIS
jgi:quinol monooxygenase YgiN